MNNKKTSKIGGCKFSSNIIANTFINDNIFVCYNEQKEPLNAFTLRKISITKPQNLYSYEDVMLSANNNNVGLGIVLGATSQGNLCGIDIDGCIDEQGNISNEAQEIINRMNSYTEISISGKGIHILFFAKKKGNKCKSNKFMWCKCLEMYDEKRYFTLSGNILHNEIINYRQIESDAIYNKYFIQGNYTFNKNLTSKILTIKDYKKHFKLALSVDKKLSNIYNGIRQTDDESYNDLVLCSKLAFWLKDYNLVKEYFLNSPYFKQKDKKHKNKCLLRKDYLHRTILKVMEGYIK